TVILDSIPPASGAVVMGTGIVSVALLLDGRSTLSSILLVLDAALWLVLAVLLPARAARDRRRFAVDLRHPTALTAIAGTEVLGTRLTLAGWDWAGAGLLVLATAIWLGLVPHVLRHWQTPTIGASFILTVATESLALLGATLAFSQRAAWLLYASLVPFCLGLGFYAFVLCRFQFRQLAIGKGDHWVTGGALAISTVAAGRIALAAQRTDTLWHGHGPVETISLVLWCLSMAWLPVLVGAEILRPRLSYNVRRWSTVFPVGMYAACSFIVGELTNTPGIVDFARVWVWVGAGVWLVVFLAMLASGRRLIGGNRILA
ncbi:MAG TPA: tellurite resistance/C4-dicarboxylate transporter family protein, partial [Solirubrobacteraceae bacterium]|nr:tellurite resistance/C4-dicarboxylate transporter family protein [Solirubrobacteraceae bacterium]